MGCSLGEVATVTIIRALVNTSAPQTSPRTLRMRIVVLISMDTISFIRRARTRPPRPATDANRLLTMTPRNARAAESKRGTAWVMSVVRKREGDSLLEGVIGSIIIREVLGVSAAEILTGEKDLIGDGATNHKSEAVHGSSEGLLKDLLARCVIFALSQATNAAASAITSATNVIRPEAGLTARLMRDAGDLHRTTMGLILPQNPLDTCEGMSDKASVNGPIGARLSAGRLKTWRGACTIAVGSSLRSCVQGRTWGPSLRLVPRRWRWMRVAGGGDTSGPDSPLATRWQRGCHPTTGDSEKSTMICQPSVVAAILLSSAREFEGALRLGRRPPRPRPAAATLPPAPTTTRRVQLGSAHRPPPTTPLPALPGIASTLASSKRALRAVS